MTHHAQKIVCCSAAQVSELLPMNECIEYMKEALIYWSQGLVVQPMRTPLWLNSEKTELLGMMPGGVSKPQKIFGIKVISIFFNSPLDSHQGAVLLFEGENGTMLSMMNAAEITAIRTAACSGVATELLMRKDIPDIECAILGSGVQARMHLKAMTAVCGNKLKRVKAWSRTTEKAQQFVNDQLKQYPNIQFEVVSSAKEAVANANIVNVVTASPSVVLEGSWIKPGAHINAVGACIASRRELDSECVAKSSLFVDSKQSALIEAGDILLPIKEGKITESHIKSEIGDLLQKKHPGRTRYYTIVVLRNN